ncbi:MAG: hypothetical protein AB9866_07205 [Syntrophobacteraceae bacterium]
MERLFKDRDDCRPGIDKQSLKLAKSLIRKSTGNLVPEDFLDDYCRVFLEIVRAKANNEQIEIEMLPEKKKAVSLLDALEKSVESAEPGKRPASRTPKAEPKEKRKAV